MSGILNNRTRIMDTVLTDIGRRALADGRLSIRFATFTDGGTFYEADAVSGSSDVQSRLMLEPSSSPHDNVAFSADDNGRVVSGPINNQFRVVKGQLFVDTFDKQLQLLTGSNFALTAHGVLSSSLDNFKNLFIVGSTGLTSLVADEGFDVSPDEVTFTITPSAPIPVQKRNVKNLDTMPSLMFDHQLSHVPNFMFLPPVNKATPLSPKKTSLGRFLPIGRTKPLSSNEVESQINAADDRGYVKTVDFTETSRQNNVFFQVFEVREGVSELVKLDVLEFGRYKTSDEKFPERTVFFVGRALKDSLERHTFVHLFTLMFE